MSGRTSARSVRRFDLKSVRGGWLMELNGTSRLFIHTSGAVSEALRVAGQAHCIVTASDAGQLRTIYDSDRDALPHRNK